MTEATDWITKAVQEMARAGQLGDVCEAERLLRDSWLLGYGAGYAAHSQLHAVARAEAAERGLLIAKLQRRLAAARLRARTTRAAGPRLRVALDALTSRLTELHTGREDWGPEYGVALSLLCELELMEELRRRPVEADLSRSDGNVRPDPSPDGGAGLSAAGTEQDQAPADA